ncbi:hypothetical protein YASMINEVIRUS_536 [Yasminevirus sp. GU-2018]|uniref:Uncharacterized protein n=1 Tax=Yasminevirus sp. GU-2018 TaxID=2420051 RepID=A0A5K0U9J6_9VIRU|nr:hypothetical protein YASMINEVIRUS_536 [Yasminevirus sp. GU-2018]
MSVRTYLVIVIILLCIAVVNNVVMYYKCYVDNEQDDPFIPTNVGVYRVNIYYNKYRYPENGVTEELKEFITPFKDKNFGRYVVTYNRPNSLEYRQISKLGNYQS